MTFKMSCQKYHSSGFPIILNLFQSAGESGLAWVLPVIWFPAGQGWIYSDRTDNVTLASPLLPALAAAPASDVVRAASSLFPLISQISASVLIFSQLKNTGQSVSFPFLLSSSRRDCCATVGWTLTFHEKYWREIFDEVQNSFEMFWSISQRLSGCSCRGNVLR